MGRMDLQVNMEQREREIADKMKSKWKDSIRNITWGFLFTLMTFNLGGLQYILPIIGGWLLYSSFRELKKESIMFKGSYYFSIINIIIILINLIIIATPLNITFGRMTIIGVVFTILRIYFIFEVRYGVKQFLKNNKVILKKDPLLSLGIWNILILFLIIIKLEITTYLLIPMTIYYFYILTRIYKIRYVFGSDYKYMVNERRKKNLKLFGVYMTMNGLVILSCCIFSNHIILNSREVETKRNEEKRNELIKIGFPKEILNDIEDKDLDFINNPIYVEVFNEELNFYSDKRKNLESITIFIETKQKEIYGIEYFKWNDSQAFWRDEIEISATDSLGLVSGNLLYKKNGKEYISNMPDFQLRVFNEEDNFLYNNVVEKIVGAINYPFKSKNNRGYICYGLSPQEGNLIGGNGINYTHYNNPIRLPYKEIGSIKPMFNKKTIQHYTNYTTELGRKNN